MASSRVWSRWLRIISLRVSAGQAGLAPARKAAISSALAYQAVLASVTLVVVAGLGGGDEVAGDEDVVAQQGGECGAGFVAVEVGDGVADVGLVLQEPFGGGVGVG